MDQQTLIAEVSRRFSSTQPQGSLFLAGSFGRGTADEWSDVDLIAMAPAEHHASIAAGWRDMLHAITPIVFWNELNRGGLVINAISDEWLRCDLSIVTRDTYGRRARDTVKPLVDRDNLYDTLPDTLPLRQPDAGTVSYLIHEFIRMLGLMPVGLGRGEYVTMVPGVGMMRGHLEALMMQDVTQPDPGGILHLSKLLPPADMEVLKALPYPGPERDALIAANFAIARIFLPRARLMAQRLGIAWPEAFEAATLRRLEQTLGTKAAF